MPRDLFATVASRPLSVRSRRAPIVSFIVHACAIAGAIVVSVVGSDTLPFPREVLAFSEPIRMAEIMPPVTGPVPSPGPKPTTSGVNTNAAPPDSPDGIKPESRFDDTPAREPEAGVING